MALPIVLASVTGLIILVVILGLGGMVDGRARSRARLLIGPTPIRGRARLAAGAVRLLESVPVPSLLLGLASEAMLHRAGLDVSASLFAGTWWLALLLAGGWSLVLMLVPGATQGRVAVCAAVMLFALAAPIAYLRRGARMRTRRLQHDLPDLLDALTLTLESGLGLEPALRRVCPRVRAPLGTGLRRMLRRLDMGYSRAQALEVWVEDTGLEEVRQLAAAIMQAERLGTSLARTLRVQASLLRSRRLHRARAAAQTAPIRVIPALVFFFLPALLLVYLAPPILLLLVR